MIGNRRHADERLTAAYTANATDLLTYFARRVEVPADAADLLGETFLIATRRSSRLPGDDEQARMWLFGIARNVLANAARGTALPARKRIAPKVGAIGAPIRKWRRRSSQYRSGELGARIKEQRDETTSILDQRHARRLLPSRGGAPPG